MPDEKTKGFMTLQKVKDMMEYAYPALAQYPKSEKFAMVTDIKKIMDEILGYCIEVSKKKSKKTSLEKLDIALAKLKTYVEMSFTLKFLPPKKFKEWSERNNEIGKMVGGLLASVATQADNHRE